MSDRERDRGQVNEDRGFPIRLIVLGIIGVILVVFIVSNNQQANVKFFALDATMPQWAIILISGVLGAAIGWLVAAVRRRNKRKE